MLQVPTDFPPPLLSMRVTKSIDFVGLAYQTLGACLYPEQS